MSRGNKYVEVYQTDLQEYETSIFYNRDEDIITFCSDVKYPWMNHTTTLLPNNQCITRNHSQNYQCSWDKFTIPFFGVKEANYEDVLKDNALACYKNCLDLEELYNFSIFVVRKKFEDDVWQIGLCGHIGYGGERFTRNEMLEKHINRMMELKIFW